MTLLFIPGAGFSSDAFAAQTAAFPESHTLDLPGQGTGTGPSSVDGFCDFIQAYVAQRDMNDVVLCGHSMGGAVALMCALRKPAWLRSAVLLGSGARLRVAPAIFESLERDFESAARSLAQWFFDDVTPQREAWTVRSMLERGQAQTIRDFRACDAFDVLDRLSEVAVPLLCVTGEHDKMTPPKFAAALADRVPGAQARIVPQAGHFVMAEQPEETNAAIAAFISAT